MTRDKRTVYVMKNADDCSHTAAHRPWHLHVVIEFAEESTAIRFERYLKSGSGRRFAKRHFEPRDDGPSIWRPFDSGTFTTTPNADTPSTSTRSPQ